MRVAVVGLGQYLYAARHAVNLCGLIRHALVERRGGSYGLKNGAGLICAADVLISHAVIENIELCIRPVLLLTLFYLLVSRSFTLFLIFCRAQLLKALVFLLNLSLVEIARRIGIIVALGRHGEHRSGVDVHDYSVGVGAFVVDIRLLERLFKVPLDIVVNRQIKGAALLRIVESLIL